MRRPVEPTHPISSPPVYGANSQSGSRLRAGLCWILILIASSVAFASDQPLDAEARRQVIKKVSATLEQSYIFGDVAQRMSEHVKAQESSGAYDDFDNPADFTHQLTEDLRSVSKDLHLWVRQMPPEDLTGAQEIPEQERRARRLEWVRLGNGGFKKLEILEGNVGYLDLRGFVDASLAGDTAHAAMRFLAQSDALIIDLRRNGGGSPSMIQLISSYFFEEPQHLNSFYVREGDVTQQFWTQANVPGPRLVDTPIYVLTSGRTFSAAEEFSYNLRNLERATLVGETTGGGAHPINVERFPELGIEMSVPYGRAVNPISGGNWEGTGVEPHIKVPADRALDVAYAQALDEILKSVEGDSDRARQLRWAKELVAESGPELSLEQKRSYVGTFGPRQISLDGERLIYQRGTGPQVDMIAVGEDRFRLDGVDDFRLRFERAEGGSVQTLVGLYLDGREEPHSRE